MFYVCITGPGHFISVFFSGCSEILDMSDSSSFRLTGITQSFCAHLMTSLRTDFFYYGLQSTKISET